MLVSGEELYGIDAKASVLQMFGLLSGDRKALETTNLIEGESNGIDPYSVIIHNVLMEFGSGCEINIKTSLNRDIFKKRIMAYLYGESKHTSLSEIRNELNLTNTTSDRYMAADRIHTIMIDTIANMYPEVVKFREELYLITT